MYQHIVALIWNFYWLKLFNTFFHEIIWYLYMLICHLSVQKLPNFYSVVYFHILISEISQYTVNSRFIKYLFSSILFKCVACFFTTVKVAFEEEFLISMHQIYHFCFPLWAMLSVLCPRYILPNLRSNIFSLMVSFSILYLLWAISNPKWWCCESATLNMSANLENSAMPQDWYRSVFIPIPKKDNAKECSNYCTIALISHSSKVLLKILQTSLQQYMNWDLPDVQTGFRKGRRIRDQIANISWIIEKAREF